MNAADMLIAASAASLGHVRLPHLLYTCHGNKLDPRKPAVRAATAGWVLA